MAVNRNKEVTDWSEPFSRVETLKTVSAETGSDARVEAGYSCPPAGASNTAEGDALNILDSVVYRSAMACTSSRAVRI